MLPARIHGLLHVLRRPRALAVVALAVALALPAPALAQVSGTDVVGGVRVSTDAKHASVAPDIDAVSGILLGPEGGELWSRGSRARRPMASTTKIMTAVLALEHGRLEETVTISRDAANVEDGIGLKAGERFTRRQLLELALVASSNDGAYALGEAVGGNMRTFVRMMNDRAKQLGLVDTHYVNPHGLDAAQHFSSAADLANLARHAMGFAEFRRIVVMPRVALPPAADRATTLDATDELLYRYPGIQGVKTGYTGDAGYCFVSMATRNGITLTAVVLGTQDNSARFAQTARLLDWGFRHAQRRDLTSFEDTAGAVPLARAGGPTVPARVGEATSAVVLDVGAPIRRAVSLQSSVTAPVFEGQRVGTVTVTQGPRTLATVPAVAAATVAAIDETVGAVPVSDFVDRVVPAVTRASSATVAKYDPARPLTRRVYLDAKTEAPVAAGAKLGEVVYTQGGKTVVRVPVVAARGVDRPGLFEVVAIMFTRGWLSVSGRPLTAARVVF